MMRIVLIFISCWVFISCSNSNRSQIITKHVTLTDFRNDSMELESFVSNARALPLQSENDDVIGNIKDICFIGDTVYILDDNTSSIHSFDIISGKHIKTLHGQGGGNQEYIQAVSITSNKDNIFLLDPMTQRILCYDKNLNYIRTIKIDFTGGDLVCYNNNLILHNLTKLPNYNYKFICLDLNGDIIDKIIPFKEDKYNSNQFNWGTNNHFTISENRFLYFYDSFANVLYCKTNMNDEFCSYFEVDFGHYTIPKDKPVNSFNIFESSYAIPTDYFFVKNTIIVSFLLDGKRYYSFIDAETGKSKTGTINYSDEKIPFFPQWSHESTLIGCCLYKEIQDNPILKEYLVDDGETYVLLFYDI